MTRLGFDGNATVHRPRQADGFADFQASLIDYSSRVERLGSPGDVLNDLHAITTASQNTMTPPYPTPS